MADFKTTLSKLLIWEGGKVNDPMDRGGKTNFGITQQSLDDFHRQNPTAGMAKDVDALDRASASDFYLFEYWIPCRGRLIKSQPLADFLVSMAVLMGKKTAVRRLQNILGVDPDGLMGAETLTAIEAASPESLIASYAKANLDFFQHIVDRDPSQAKFLAGWTNRVKSFA